MVTDMGNLGGGESWVEDVNSSGQAAGRSRIQVGSYLVIHGFWYDSAIYDQGTLYPADYSTSWTKAINDAKQTVGYTDYDDNGTKRTRAFRWTDLNDDNVVDSGEMIQLGVLSGFTSSAWGINNSGQVTGTSQSGTGLLKYDHAFRWTDLNSDNLADADEMIDLGTLTGNANSKSSGIALNDSGAVVGDGQILSGVSYHAFYYRDDIGMIDLGTIDNVSGSSRAEDINNSHVVVGNSPSSLGNSRAFRWFDDNGNNVSDLGEMVDLGDLGGPESKAWGINNDGHIVGHSWTTASGDVRAFIHRDVAMTDLNDLIDPTSIWTLEQAMAIGDAGHIVVGGNDGSPGSHALLLTPLIPGDAKYDGAVDVTDLGILATNYGTTGGAVWGDADFTDDSAVDVDDLGVLATYYGHSIGGHFQPCRT